MRRLRSAAGLATAALLLLAIPIASAADTASEKEIRRVATALAKPSMRGRGAGSPELDRARDLLRRELENLGLAPGFGAAWFQEFDGPDGERLANVSGVARGRGEGWIVVGAHYDGLGVGVRGSEHEGEVHPGADDNASGVAALVRIAGLLARAQDLERSVWLVGFSGEELGLLGSRRFVEEPPADLARCAAMINLDTVGRIENGRLLVFGSGTADEWPAILAGTNHAFRFDLALRSEGAGASDHTPFFEKGIPVLHFFSGAKPEYHRPGDKLETLEFGATAKLAEYVAELAGYLAASGEALTFRPAGADRVAPGKGSSGSRRVSLGTIPDFTRESGGVLLSGVMPGSPAEAAGLAKGDVLTGLDGVTIDTLNDLQAALASRAPGDEVVVRWMRAAETREARVTLAERR